MTFTVYFLSLKVATLTTCLIYMLRISGVVYLPFHRCLLLVSIDFPSLLKLKNTSLCCVVCRSLMPFPAFDCYEEISYECGPSFSLGPSVCSLVSAMLCPW